MRVIITESPAESSRVAAESIRRRMQEGRLQTLGVATGSSPLGIYRTLAGYGAEPFRGVTVFALDEYVGLDPRHPQSPFADDDRIPRPRHSAGKAIPRRDIEVLAESRPPCERWS